MANMSLLSKFGLWTLLLGSGVFASPAAKNSKEDCSKDDVIQRDVVIIGGGSSGTNAAIQLLDAGKSVVVIESKGRLGGHTETYHDPATKKTIDIGVVVWHNISQVTNYFSRLNVSLTIAGGDNTTLGSYDFRTGKPLTGYTPPSQQALGQALQIYGQQVAKYPGLATGYNLPDPVPEDLLLPFKDFAKKYAIDAAVYQIFSFNQGVGDHLTIPTLYAMKIFGLDLLQSLQTGLLTTAASDNSLLYEAATRVLGQNALLSSNVTKIIRGGKAGSGVEVEVNTPSGKKVIKAKKLVIAIPPLISNLKPFLDLTSNETSLFSKWTNSAYYTGLIRNDGLSDTIQYRNFGTDNATYNLPTLPASYIIYPSSVQGLHNVKFGSPYALTESQVKETVKQDVGRLGGNTQTLEWEVYSSHTPFELRVTAEEIKNGFYNRLNALQGVGNTFWTGAAWQAHDSGVIWRFNQILVGKILATL